MSGAITQRRICYLETVGEDHILELVADGLHLEEIIGIIDPGKRHGVSKHILTRWLEGKELRTVPFEFDVAGIEGKSEVRGPETQEDGEARAKRYAEARQTWALVYAEGAGKNLMQEADEKMASLRKAQADFALRMAAVWDTRFGKEKNQVAVQVNINDGELHLQALQRRRSTPLPSPNPAVYSLPLPPPSLPRL